MGYFTDSLFRRDTSVAAAAASGAAKTAESPNRTSSRDAAEVGRIFMNVSRTQPLPPEDIRCVGQIVAQRILGKQDLARACFIYTCASTASSFNKI